MWEQHWGIAESPFQAAANPKYFVQNACCEEALARLEFLVKHRRRVGLVVGDSGSGKTLLLKTFAEQIRAAKGWATLLNPQTASVEQFFAQLAAGLCVNLKTSDTTLTLWQKTIDAFAALRFEQRKVVLLIDDADQTSAAVQGVIRQFIVAENDPASQLTVVLSSHTSRWQQLDPAILDWSALRIELDPWTPDDVYQYVTESITKAGRAEKAFEAAAIQNLHTLTGGIPRQVAQLAELSLIAAAGDKLESVPANVVEQAHEELAVNQCSPA